MLAQIESEVRGLTQPEHTAHYPSTGLAGDHSTNIVNAINVTMVELEGTNLFAGPSCHAANSK